MQVVLFLAADYAVKEESGKLNVLGIFNQVYAPNFPAIHHSMYLVIRLVTGLGEFNDNHDMKIIFVDSDGNELIAQEGQIAIQKPEQGRQVQADLVLHINDLLLPKEGQYEFRLILNKEVRAEIPLDVIQRDKKSGQ
jgi:hypothetical protein